MERTVVVMRKGKPKRIAYAVWAYERRKRAESRFKREKADILARVLALFQNDSEQASQWLKTHYIPKLHNTPQGLLNKQKVKGLKLYLSQLERNINGNV